MLLIRRASVTIIAIFGMFAGILMAAEPVSKSKSEGIAIGGHDAAAYHQLPASPHQAAVQGSQNHVVSYKGANWHFGSRKSADLFKANPERYSPAYNGHCANALSLGRGLLQTDGTHWEIFGDKLYLFFAARGRDRWLDGNWEKYKLASDAAWEKIVNP